MSEEAYLAERPVIHIQVSVEEEEGGAFIFEVRALNSPWTVCVRLEKQSDNMLCRPDDELIKHSLKD